MWWASGYYRHIDLLGFCRAYSESDNVEIVPATNQLYLGFEQRMAQLAPDCACCPFRLSVFSKYMGSGNSKDAAPIVDEKRGAVAQPEIVSLILGYPPQRDGKGQSAVQ